MPGGKIAFERGERIRLVGPGDGEMNEGAVFEPEGMLLGRGEPNDINGNGDVCAERNVLGAEDMAFGRSEVALDLFVGKIMELDRVELLTKALDDAGDRVVDGWMLANVSTGSERGERQTNKAENKGETGNVPTERTSHHKKGNEMAANHKAGCWK